MGAPPGRSRVRVTVCAARDAGDVDAILEGGADGVGVLVLTRHRAEDAVSIDVARGLLAAVPPPVSRYAVTHAIDYESICGLVEALPIDTLQLHDDIEVATVEELRAGFPGIRFIKALHVSGGAAPQHRQWDGVVDALVVDSVNPAEDRIGGTGLVHDWSITAGICREAAMPVYVAGGLHAGNVAGAVAATGAYAANVNSGVEVGGRKDAALIRAFVGAANAGCGG